MACKNCNKPTKKWGKFHVKYCNLLCKREYEKTKFKVYFKPRNCKVCDKVFNPVSSVNKFCSKKCKNRDDADKRSFKPKTKVCKQCDNIFSPYTSLDKFCSTQCRIDSKKSKRSKNWSKEKAEGIKGKNNPCFRHGNYMDQKTNSLNHKQRFFMKVRDSMRERMKEEHGYLFCENCNTNHSYQWEMHHIIFRSEKPDHEHIHNEKNLINLCMSCHNLFHKDKGYRDELVVQRGLHLLFGDDIKDKKDFLKKAI